ncbi:hypothetical protein [Micromonospora humida]|uniref:hypothetical protein n=1 Tax=Micromonospora humida TaxID=2809018 RepID=UPI003F4E2ECA
MVHHTRELHRAVGEGRGVLLAAVCALVGLWVIAPGMLPGVAIASILGGNLVVGAAASAFAMAAGVNALRHSREFGRDTSVLLVCHDVVLPGQDQRPAQRATPRPNTENYAVPRPIGEILALRREDLDLATERPTLTIRGTLVFVKSQGNYRQPWTKSDAGYRMVVLPRFAVGMLMARKLDAPDNPHDAIFASRRGT